MLNPRLFKLENSLFSETVLPANDYSRETFSPSLLGAQNLISPSEYSCTDAQSSQNSCEETKMDGKFSASETLERYLNAYTPETFHISEHSYSQMKLASQTCGASVVHSVNLTNHSAGNVTSFTARDIAQTSTPQNLSGYECHRSTRGAENSEHCVSSTSSVLSTLDKLREKLSQPARNEFNLSNGNFGLQYSPFGLILPQTAQPILPNEIQNLNMPTKLSNFVCNEYNQAQEMGPANLVSMNNAVKIPAEKEVRDQTPQTVDNHHRKNSEPSRENVGYSPMDLVKLAETPVSSSGLSLRSKSSSLSSQRVARKATTAAKTKTASTPNNLRRSRSLASMKNESPSDTTVVPPKNVSWEHGSPEPKLEQTPFTGTSIRQGMPCGCNGSYQNPMILPYETNCPVNFKSNCVDSVVSFKCSTCVPKPLKPRSKTNTPRSGLPVEAKQPNVITKSSDHNYISNLPTLTVPECVQLPSPADAHGTHFASSSNLVSTTKTVEEKKTSHRTLPSNSASLRPPIPAVLKATKEIRQSNVSPERPWHKQNPSSKAVSTLQSGIPPVPTESRQAITEYKPALPPEPKAAHPSNSKISFTPTWVEQTKAASSTQITQEPIKNFNTNRSEGRVVNQMVVDSNLPSQRTPAAFSKSSSGATGPVMSSEPAIPPINVCNNESYVSAFDHLPLRCSTPRSLIPSHRPISEVTTFDRVAETVSDHLLGPRNHVASDQRIGGVVGHGMFAQQSPLRQVNSDKSVATNHASPRQLFSQTNSDPLGFVCQVNSDRSANVNRVTWNRPGTEERKIPVEAGTVSKATSDQTTYQSPFNPLSSENKLKKPSLSDLESFRILTESAIENNESDMFDTVIENGGGTNSS